MSFKYCRNGVLLFNPRGIKANRCEDFAIVAVPLGYVYLIRAPLFEVQTDSWECFCSILWDPAHADCAVRQLLPRLAAKRREVDIPKNTGSQDRAEDVINIRNP